MLRKMRSIFEEEDSEDSEDSEEDSGKDPKQSLFMSMFSWIPYGEEYSSDPPILEQCFVCGKKIVMDTCGSMHPFIYKPICKTYSPNGCQVKLRAICKLSENMHKSIILRESKCHYKGYNISSTNIY